jgi:hypothetical protein
LCVSEELGGVKVTRFVRYQTSLLQSLLGPVLPESAYRPHELGNYYLRRTAPEPGLAISAALHERGINPAILGVPITDVPSQVTNVLRELGLISAPGPRIDPISEILHARFGVPRTKSWHKLLGAEYVLALGLLKQAEAAFAGGRSYWLATQNSFNQSVFLRLQSHLNATGHPARCKTVNRKGELIDFGVTLDAKGPFSQHLPQIADCFREMNARRNTLPVAHPYEKKTAAPARHLRADERNRFVAQLRKAYAAVAAEMP